MKLFFEKTNIWLVKNYQSGIVLLLIAGFVAYTPAGADLQSVPTSNKAEVSEKTK